jgi:transposase-like protein
MRYIRFPLSLGIVEEQLHERCIEESHAAIRYGLSMISILQMEKVANQTIPSWTCLRLCNGL